MKVRRLVLLITMLVSFGIPAWAHHSFSAVFDADSPVQANGTVTKVEWRNPHAWIYIDVEGENGNVVNWAFELGSPNGLRRRGWSRDTVKVGDVISVSGYRARDGSNRGNVASLTLADGRELTGNSSRYN
ncbi:MAG: hypothetical protein ACI88G_001278 [Woeseiaceae bacterium]|jgi:hypothetical protein